MLVAVAMVGVSGYWWVVVGVVRLVSGGWLAGILGGLGRTLLIIKGD